MASLSLYPQLETNLMSNGKVIELLLQLKGAKTHGTNYIKVRPPLVRHLSRNRPLKNYFKILLKNFMLQARGHLLEKVTGREGGWGPKLLSPSFRSYCALEVTFSSFLHV